MNLVSFGSVCDLQNGRAFKPSEWADAGTPIVRIQNLNDETKPFNYCDFEVEERFHIQSGDLLFSWSGTPGTSFGAFFWNRGKAFLNQHIFRVDIDENIVDKNYLRHAINSKLTHIIDQAHGGVGLKHITKGKLEAVEIYLPKLTEQNRIAAILDKADSLRRKNQQAIQLADKFLRAVFLDMFGDPVTNPKGWDESLLSQLCNGKMNNGIFKKNEEYGEGKPVAWVGELFGTHEIIFSEKTNKVTPSAKEIDKYGMNYGDILFCRSSLKLEGIGWSNVYLGKDSEALFECHVIRMPPKLDYINPVFLNFQLRLPGIRRRVFAQAKTVTMTTIDQEGLGKVKVIIPNKELQDKFEKIHRKTIGFVKRFDQQHEADNLFNALSQKAFSGKI